MQAEIRQDVGPARRERIPESTFSGVPHACVSISKRTHVKFFQKCGYVRDNNVPVSSSRCTKQVVGLLVIIHVLDRCLLLCF